MWRRGKQTRPGRMYPDPPATPQQATWMPLKLSPPTSPTSQNSDEDTVTGYDDRAQLGPGGE